MPAAAASKQAVPARGRFRMNAPVTKWTCPRRGVKAPGLQTMHANASEGEGMQEHEELSAVDV